MCKWDIEALQPMIRVCSVSCG